MRTGLPLFGPAWRGALTARLEQVDHPLRLLFESPTVGSLAPRVSAALSSSAELAPPPPLSRRADAVGPAPLSFAQQRLWFLHQMEPEGAAYNVPAALRLSGGLDVAALGRTLDEVVRRHEVLRTGFGSVDGNPVQLVQEPRPVPLPVDAVTVYEAPDPDTPVTAGVP